jgi:hypothetical protein
VRDIAVRVPRNTLLALAHFAHLLDFCVWPFLRNAPPPLLHHHTPPLVTHRLLTTSHHARTHARTLRTHSTDTSTPSIRARRLLPSASFPIHWCFECGCQIPLPLNLSLVVLFTWKSVYVCVPLSRTLLLRAPSATCGHRDSHRLLHQLVPSYGSGADTHTPMQCVPDRPIGTNAC